MISEKLYYDNVGIIYKEAQRLSNKTGIEFDELIAQGNLIFCESIKKYNENKTKFSTYVFYCVRWGLLNYIEKEYNKNNDQTYIDIEDILKNIYYKDHCFDKILFYDKVLKMNIDCRYVMNIILFPDTKQKKATRLLSKNSLKNYLRKNGWKIPRIERTFNQIEKEFIINDI